MSKFAAIPVPTATRVQQLMADLRAARHHRRAEKADRLWSEIKQEEIPLDLAHLRPLCALAEEIGEQSYALNLLLRACTRFPERVELLNEASSLLIRMGRDNEARTLVARALALEPESPVAVLNHGAILLNAGLHSRALVVLETANRLLPRNAAVLNNLAVAQNSCGRPEAALESARLATRADAGNAVAHATLGALYAQAGETKLALSAYRRGLRADPTSGACHLGIAELTTFSNDDHHHLDQMEALRAQPLAPHERALLRMALGKAYDDLGAYALAFEHYRIGNTLRRPHSIADCHAALEALDRACAALARRMSSVARDATVRPIFIVGMPRSGTTLIEQMLSHHPGIATAGELTTLPELVDELIGAFDARTDFAARLTPEVRVELRTRYLERLSHDRKPGARFVIDKAPGNHVFIGLIRLLFPEAVVVHATRHPLDTCWSCHTRNLGTLRWTTDLEWIALHYRRYRAFVDRWQAEASDSLVDVAYERLVAAPATELRPVLERCGLPWDERCLDPRAPRGAAVRTASAQQVRQPIYRSAVGRWVNYAPHLGPLAAGLKPFLSREDLEILRRHGAAPRTGALALLRALLSRPTRA